MAGWRYIAQNPRTGAFIDWELPLRGVTLTRRLSGPWGMSATLSPEYPRFTVANTGDRLLDEWRVQVWAEQDGQIRGGGILTGSKIKGETWELTLEGHARYPYGIPYLDRYRQAGVDAADVYRHIWDHLQAQPGGDLGIVVDPTDSGVLLGDAEEPVELAWWEAPDCGEELENLAAETPFEFEERHQWGTGDEIEHRIVLGHPRLGRRRTDIGFVEGENVATPTTIEVEGDEFAQYVIGLGAGEGRTRLRTPVVGTDDGRLRRVRVLERADVRRSSRLGRLTAVEQAARKHMTRIPDLAVKQHPNAPLGSWQLGDEVLLTVRSGWADEAVWCRIVEETVAPESASEVAVLRLIRADGV